MWLLTIASGEDFVTWSECHSSRTQEPLAYKIRWRKMNPTAFSHHLKRWEFLAYKAPESARARWAMEWGERRCAWQLFERRCRRRGRLGNGIHSPYHLKGKTGGDGLLMNGGFATMWNQGFDLFIRFIAKRRLRAAASRTWEQWWFGAMARSRWSKMTGQMGFRQWCLQMSHGLATPFSKRSLRRGPGRLKRLWLRGVLQRPNRWAWLPPRWAAVRLVRRQCRGQLNSSLCSRCQGPCWSNSLQCRSQRSCQLMRAMPEGAPMKLSVPRALLEGSRAMGGKLQAPQLRGDLQRKLEACKRWRVACPWATWTGWKAMREGVRRSQSMKRAWTMRPGLTGLRGRKAMTAWPEMKKSGMIGSTPYEWRVWRSRATGWRDCCRLKQISCLCGWGVGTQMPPPRAPSRTAREEDPNDSEGSFEIFYWKKAFGMQGRRKNLPSIECTHTCNAGRGSMNGSIEADRMFQLTSTNQLCTRSMAQEIRDDVPIPTFFHTWSSLVLY